MQISSISMFKVQNTQQNTAVRGERTQQYIQNAGDTFCKSTNNVAFKGDDNIGLLPQKITPLTRKEAVKQGYTCVSTAEELQKALNINEKVCLMKDIKLNPNSENNWNPIAEFSNEFNGNGFAITGVRINQPNKDYVGLFGKLEFSTNVGNLILTDAKIAGRDKVGGLAGEIFNFARVVNNHIEADVTGKDWVGGLAGEIFNHAKAVNNHIEADVTGKEYVGGLTGFMCDSAATENNHIEAFVTGEQDVGGLAGFMCDSASAVNNHIEADVTGKHWVGGLAGFMCDSASAVNNHIEADVTGKEYVGGLAGWLDNYTKIENNRCLLKIKQVAEQPHHPETA